MNHTTTKYEGEIETTAATWCARRDASLSVAEQAELERWISADPRHAAAIAEFESMWLELGRARRTGAAADVKRECAELRRRRMRRNTSIATASAVVVLFIGLLLPRWTTKEIPPASTSAIMLPASRTLPDGSVVELKDGARIAVKFTANGIEPRRVMLLHGEAHFQVAQGKERPFIVTAGGIEVHAVGTAFIVGLGAEKVEVVVTEGRVEVESPAESQTHASKVPIAAGNRVVLERSPQSGAQAAIAPISLVELTERLAWRNPRVEFSHARLSEVVTLVNRHSRLQFRIADPGLEQVTLSGLFRVDDGEALAYALERSFGVKVERQSETQAILRRAE